MHTFLLIGGFIAAAMAAFAGLSWMAKVMMWLVSFIFVYLAWRLRVAMLVVLDSYLFSISQLDSPIPAFATTIPAIAVLLLLVILMQGVGFSPRGYQHSGILEGELGDSGGSGGSGGSDSGDSGAT